MGEEMRQLVDELRYAATHDALTQVLARGAWFASAQCLIAKARSAGDRTAVLMLDIDHFKRINDRFGHAAGDRSLTAFARAVRQSVDDRTVLGRLGGEEFALAFRLSSSDGVGEILETIRSPGASLSVDLGDGTTIAFTVSGGVVVRDSADDDTLDTMLAVADRALYLAKAAGRNRIVADEGVVVARDPRTKNAPARPETDGKAPRRPAVNS